MRGSQQFLFWLIGLVFCLQGVAVAGTVCAHALQAPSQEVHSAHQAHGHPAMSDHGHAGDDQAACCDSAQTEHCSNDGCTCGATCHFKVQLPTALRLPVLALGDRFLVSPTDSPPSLTIPPLLRPPALG